jgi:Aerotolerance regulator N-terminal/von Willebrand factor type A domain
MLLAPLFLIGLLGIGLPLWLHRFARDTRTKEPFASLMLLEPSQIHRSREHQLKYLLLLALRIALLALLVFAFTQPMWPWRTPPLQAGDRVLHVIVLDTSLSMREGERWTRAVEKARSLIGAMRSADQGMLVTADSRVRVVRGPVNQSAAEELRSALASLQPGPARLDYGMLMTNATSWMGTERPPTQLHFITDLQQTATPLQFADLEPPEGVKLLLEDVGDVKAANRAVRSVGVAEHDSNSLEVRVIGAGTARTVVLAVDGKEKERKTVAAVSAGATGAALPRSAEGALLGAPAGAPPGTAGAPPGTDASRDAASGALGATRPGAPPESDAAARGDDPQGRNLETPVAGAGTNGRSSAVLQPAENRLLFNDINLGPGTHRITVALEPADTLPQDDQFYAVLERREPRALVIGAASAGDDVSYFSAAVGALTSPRLAVERTGSDAISQRALADYSALIVSDVGVLSGPSIGALQRYLEGGGSVLVTLGPRAAQQDRIPLSGHTRDTRSLKSQNSTATAGGNGDIAGRVAAVEESHPALRNAQGWRSVRFFRYVPVESQQGDHVLIRFEDGHPLLIERQIGAGRLLVLTSPLNRDWNDLAIHPLFVRFIGEAARYMTAAAAAPNTLVGSVLPLGINGRIGAQVFDPGGQRVLALSDTAGQTRLIAAQPGFYEVRGGGRSDWIAVNADPRESDLARMPDNSIAQWNRLQTPERATAAVQQANADPGPQLKAIWPWLLLLAVTLAFVEPLVANSHLHVRRGVAS